MTNLNSSFNLLFKHDGKQYDCKARFVRLGYIHQFHVNVGDRVVIIEFDEQQQYRLLDTSLTAKPLEQGLLETIVEQVSLLHQD